MTCPKQLFGFWHVILLFRHLSLKSSEKHQHLFLKTSASFFIFSAIFHPFFCIFFKSVPNKTGDEISQFRIAVQQPAAEGNTIGLVIELLRIKLVEVVLILSLFKISV